MILDSSALLAVIFDEEDADRFLLAMAEAPVRQLSAANWLETAMCVDNHRDPRTVQKFAALLAHLSVEIVPVSLDVARAARVASQRFGRKSGTKARLNFGDCFAYALAHTTQEPLLFKGDDFTHTDTAQAAY